MAQSPQEVANHIRAGLHRARHPEKAEQVRAYLRSTLPCLGVSADDRHRVVDKVLHRHEPDASTWRWIVYDLWNEPSYREERYAAIDVLAHPSLEDHRDGNTLTQCHDLIVEGAWWDLVDGVTVAVNDILIRHRRVADPVVRQWSVADDLWIRRAAITSQLRSHGATDVELLRDVILASAGLGEFFLDQAIGWALREHARADREWVRAFVAEHADVLGEASRREVATQLP